MRALLGLYLLILSGPLFGSSKPPHRAYPELAWLAFGDLRGNVSPCGCDPLTDLGGIRRLSRFVAETRKAQPNVLLFSLGENFPVKSEPGKAAAIQETLKELKPDALLWRGPEIKQKPDGGLPYVLSHMRKKHAGVSPMVVLKQAVVLGFDENGANTQSFSRDLEKDWRKLLAAHKGKNAILLFSGKTSTLERIQKSGLFTEVISANTAPANAEPTQQEKSEPGRLLRSGSYMVPSFGQGLLRGGSLRSAPRIGLPLDCKPHSLEPRCQKKSSLMGGGEDLFTWLDQSWDGPSPADPIFDRYNKGAADVFASLAASRVGDLKNSPFIGAAACASCHAAAFKVWEKSKHAHAWNTLKVKGKEKDPECVGCHVLGYAAKGGFADMETSPQFANVQCESCHGPRREHATNPAIKPPHNARAACASCHTPPHSPRFNADSYWQQIKH